MYEKQERDEEREMVEEIWCMRNEKWMRKSGV